MAEAIRNLPSILPGSSGLYAADTVVTGVIPDIDGWRDPSGRLWTPNGGWQDVVLSTPSINDNAAPGTKVGTLSVIGNPDARFSLASDAGGMFALSGSDVIVGATPLDAVSTPRPRIRVFAWSATYVALVWITIAVRQPNAALEVSAAFPPPATVGEAFNFPLGITGGVRPYTVTLADAALPAGWVFNAGAAAITAPAGAVTTEGPVKLGTLTVRDAAGATLVLKDRATYVAAAKWVPSLDEADYSYGVDPATGIPHKADRHASLLAPMAICRSASRPNAVRYSISAAGEDWIQGLANLKTQRAEQYIKTDFVEGETPGTAFSIDLRGANLLPDIPGNFLIIKQLHAHTLPGDGNFGPVLGMNLSTLGLMIDTRAAKSSPVASNPPSTVHAFVPFRQGVENHFVVEVRLGTQGNGRLLVALNGAIVVKVDNIDIGLAGHRHYWKDGVYEGFAESLNNVPYSPHYGPGGVITAIVDNLEITKSMSLRDRRGYTGLAVPPPTPLLLQAYDSLTGLTTSGTAPERSMDPAVMLPATSIKTSYLGTTTSGAIVLPQIANVDTTDWGVIVWVQHVEKPIGKGVGEVRKRFTVGGTNYDGPSFFYNGVDETEGVRIEARHVSEIAAGTLVGKTGVAQLRDFNTPKGGGPGLSPVRFGAVYIKSKGIATIVPTNDDTPKSTTTYLQPLFQSHDIVFTQYIDWANLNTFGHQTDDDIKASAAAGNAICLNGTGDDRHMMEAKPRGSLVFNTMAALLAEIAEGRAKLAALGLPAEGGNHVTAPFGLIAADYMTTTNGAPDAKLNPPVNAAVTMTPGSPDITLGAAANIANGSTVYVSGFPDGATVLSGGGSGVTSLRLSANCIAVAGQTKTGTFIDERSEFYPGKLGAALRGIGVKTLSRVGRQNGVNDDIMFTRFGMPMPYEGFFRKSFTNATWAQIEPIFNQVLMRGGTLAFVTHATGPGMSGVNQPDTVMEPAAKWIGDNKRAGNLVCHTVPHLWARDGDARLPLAA